MAKSKIDRETLPYRPCAGVALFNRQGQVFMGRRNRAPDADEGDAAAPWQMPQGGIDKGEDHAVAALRELHEETNVTSVEIIGKTDDWLHYELPDAVLGIALKGKYRGQKQKWFAVLLTGDESEINVLAPMNGQASAEFDAWQWVELSEITDLVVAFKRDVYDQIAQTFADLPARIRNGDI